MSTICVGHKTFMAVYEKAVQCRTRNIISYHKCGCLENKTDKQLAEWVQSLSKINEKSYRKAYGDRVADQTWEHTYLEDITAYNCGDENISVYQMLKYLHGISYNIEASLADQKEVIALALLEEVINEITSAIISSIKEYDNAKWV